MTVELGDRSYPVMLDTGGLEGLGSAIASVLGSPRCIVVSNDVVWPLLGGSVEASLADAGLSFSLILVPDGEEQKNLTRWRGLVEEMLRRKVDRGTAVVAVGGGVIGDLAGFAAATVMRGLPLVQVPTTLLAMVDSSVGGKTGVNTDLGKNLVGAFHQPQLVFASMGTLSTLSDDEFRSGLGEVVKHGVLGDRALFEVCGSQAKRIVARDPLLSCELVERSIRVKAGVVAQDEREAGLRAILNLGHTVGHAIEATLLRSGSPLAHGVCVGLGLIAEVRWAEACGVCPEGTGDRVQSVLSGLGLPIRSPPIELDELLNAASFDKKVVRGTLRTAIVEDIGRVRLTEIPQEEVRDLFNSLPGFLR
jgi:3-dehydroquinate synthase